MRVQDRMANRVEHIAKQSIILHRKFLDDEQLIRSEQLVVLEEIFNENVRDPELSELASHFGSMLRGDHPMHLAIWGNTGTGKTLTVTFFLNMLEGLCRKRRIPMKYLHLDLTTPRPCFRALNDLACLLSASKRYKKGISLDEIMNRIEDSLQTYSGYLLLFVDEAYNIRRDRDAFMAFLVRRLPQRIPGKLILTFASNQPDWLEELDARIRSFLKVNEIMFKPYDAVDLGRILKIRVEKALCPGAVDNGVIEKIAALASHERGDARRAVGLLAKSAHLAERRGAKSVSLQMVDEAVEEMEQDKYSLLIRSSPPQLQAVLGALIEAHQRNQGKPISTGSAYEAYAAFCEGAALKPLAGRAFSDLIADLELMAFIRCRILSRGRLGRSREIRLQLPAAVAKKLYATVCSRFDLGGRLRPTISS